MTKSAASSTTTHALTVFLLATFFLALTMVERVDAADTGDWLNYLIPLPKEIRITGEKTVPISDMAICTAIGSGPVERQAAEEFAGLLGIPVVSSPTGKGLEILIGIPDTAGRIGGFDLSSEVTRLRSLPNSDQAYCILQPDSRTIVCAGLDEKGVYHSVQTMKQLLGPQAGKSRITIPDLSLTDWPDMPERGLWDDFFTPDHLDFLASVKMNTVDCHVRLTVDKDGRGGVGSIPRKGYDGSSGIDYMTVCRLHGIHYVPTITHLSHLERTGIYEVFPDLVGVGASIDDRFIPPCAKHPEFITVLADWMTALAGTPGIGEICIWLSEVEQQCDCPECRAAGQYVMETRAIIAAFTQVKERFPGLKIRILLTQGSYPTNDKVLAEIPPDVGVVYYHGEKTYDSSREPMIDFSFREFIAKGGKLGVCPQLTVSWAVVCPWSSPQFVKSRMNEFYDKGLYLLSAYATPDIFLYDFNIAAAAEWSWNAHGRSEREFALAWATIKRLNNPEAAADWAVTLGAVSWDVFGSGTPYSFIPGFGNAPAMIENRVRPVLGEDVFRYFPTVASFDAALGTCGKAHSLAEKTGSPKLIEETAVVRGYIELTRELYFIANIISGGIPGGTAREHLERFLRVRDDTNAALKRWEILFGEGLGGGRFAGTIELNDNTAALLSVAVGKWEKEAKR